MNELKLDINIDKDVAQGRYANLALIAHTKNEFILDFALLQPQGGGPRGEPDRHQPPARQGPPP